MIRIARSFLALSLGLLLSGCVATLGGLVGSRMSAGERYSSVTLAELDTLPVGQLVSIRDRSDVVSIGEISGRVTTPEPALTIAEETTGRALSIPLASIASAMKGRRAGYGARGFLLGLVADVAIVIYSIGQLPVW